MEYLFSALHSLAASLFLSNMVYRAAVAGALTYFDVFLGALILYVVFHNNNSSKRYLCLEDEDTNSGFFHWLLKSIRSADFWLCALIIVTPVSFIAQKSLAMPVYWMIGIMLIMLLMCEAQQCRRWAEAYYDYCELRVEHSAKDYVKTTRTKPVKKAINMALGCIAVAGISVLLYLYRLATPVLMFVVYEAGTIIILILGAVPVLMLLRGFGCMRKRRSAVKALAQICNKYGYTLTDNTKIFKGLYYSTGKTDLMIEKGDRRYGISFLPIPYKISSIIFYTDKKYRFRPTAFGMSIPLPLHAVGFGDEYGEKYLLFTKPASRARLYDGRRYNEIDNGEVLYGAKAYSVSAFMTYFDRLARKDHQ